MPQLIQILSSDVEQPNIKEQVCWTIGNIAGECDDFRLTLLANGCLRPLHRCCISRSGGCSILVLIESTLLISTVFSQRVVAETHCHLGTQQPCPRVRPWCALLGSW